MRIVCVMILGVLGSACALLASPNKRVVLQDNLTNVGFSVSFSTTTNVSGGGSALQNAVNAASSSTRLLITDSLTYDPVIVTNVTDLTIEANTGQTPVIQRVSPSHNTGGWCLTLQGTIDGFAIRGVTFHGNGNRNTLSFYDDGLLDARWDVCTSADRIIVDSCDFLEDGSDNANSGPGILIGGTTGTNHLRVWIHQCTFANNANGAAATPNGYGACTVIGYNQVYIQNCSAIRTDAIVARASSNMRGFCFNNNSTILEDCLANDLGIAGSNEGFKHVNGFGSESTAGPATIRNCVSYNCKRGYREDHPSQSMAITNSVYDCDATGICEFAIRLTNTGTSLTIADSILVGAGDGTAFDNAAISENHNDVFTFGAVGLTLSGTDLTVDPKFTSVAQHNWIAKTHFVKTGASDGGSMGVRYPGGETIIWAGH